MNSKHETANIFGYQSELTTEIVTPKVSIIIPAYNTAAYIVEALDSVFAQTYKNFEVIVINDGSPDTEELESVLKVYYDRITYLKQENQGAGPARNAGLKIASGELIAFLDSDDIWMPEFLNSQVAFLEKNKFDLVWSDAYLFGDIPFSRRTWMHYVPSKGEVTFESLLDKKCTVITSATVACKKTLMSVNGFAKYDIPSEDFDLWLRIALIGARFGYQRDALLRYRVRLDNLSGNSIKKLERDINTYSRILDEFNLNSKQIKIVKSKIHYFQAALKIEHAKISLLSNKFSEVKTYLKEANGFFHSIKLTVVLIILGINPKLISYLFKLRWKKYIHFITSKNQD